MNQNNINTDTITAIANVDALLKEQKELKKALKEQKDLEAWETKTKERNPQLILGSVRKPTTADENELGHVHGMVCSITCQTCGVVRIINKQDAFQVRFCKEHKSEARKAKAKAKRQEAKIAGKSADEIQTEIDELRSLLGKKETEVTETEAIVTEELQLHIEISDKKTEAKAKRAEAKAKRAAG